MTLRSSGKGSATRFSRDVSGGFGKGVGRKAHREDVLRRTVAEILEPRQLLSSTLIDIQFNSSGQTAQTGAAVLGGNSDVWNNIVSTGTPSGTNVPLVDTTNAATSVTVTYSAQSEGHTDSSPFGSGLDNLLMSNYLVADSSTAPVPGPPGSVVFSGLSSGSQYSVVLYSGSDFTYATGETVFTVNGYTKTTQFSQNENTFSENDNYVEIQTTADANGKITVSFDQANEMAGILNGVQLQQLAAAPYTLSDVGSLPGSTSTSPSAVNDAGDVVGTANVLLTTTEGEIDQAFITTANGDSTDLGTLTEQSLAYAVNNSDEVAGQSQTPENSNSPGDAFVWTSANPASAIDLGVLPGDQFSAALGINNSGEAVGYSSDGSEDFPNAFTWTESGGMVALPMTVSGSDIVGTEAQAINDQGTVVGEADVFDSSTDSDSTEACYWLAGGQLQLLPTPSGLPNSQATAINSSGEIVGQAYDGSTSTGDEVIWNSGVANDIGQVTTGYSGAFGVNNAGQVVGYDYPQDEGNTVGFVWTSDTGNTDLSTLIPSSNYTEDGAYSINNSGQILTDAFTNNLYQEVPLLLTPTPPTATNVSAPNLTTAGAATNTISVTYTSTTADIDTTTLAGSNITVLDPQTSMPLNVTLKGFADVVAGNGESVTATYLVDAPNGTFTAADDGAYGITVNAGAVKDVNGNGNTTASGFFEVVIPDTTPPVGVISTPNNITTAGAATETVTITYTDNVDVDVESIDTDNISVIGPGSQSLTVTGVSTTPESDATTVTATYTVAAPGGAFEASDNGTYTVSLLSNQVTDESDNAAAPTSATFTVSISNPVDLQITNSAPATSVAGSVITYTIVATDAGPSAVTGATVSDTFPGTLTGITYTSNITGIGNDTNPTGSTRINDAITLSSGSSITYHATGTLMASAGGAIVDTATISVPAGYSDSDLTNNTASSTIATTPLADLQITNIAPSTAIAGNLVTYTIVATDAGPSAVTGASVVDTFPGTITGITYASTLTGIGNDTNPTGSTSINDVVTLNSGSSITYRVTGTLASAASGAIVDTATVSVPAGYSDPTLANNTASSTIATTPLADLQITNIAPSTALAGNVVTYTIVATNAGPTGVVGASVVDPFPSTITGITYTSNVTGIVSDTNPTGSTGINDMVTLSSGSSITYTVIGTLTSTASGAIVDTATISVPVGYSDPSLANNTASSTIATTPLADLQITNSAPSAASAGNVVTYTIVATDAGPSNVISATVVDTFPATLTGITYTSSISGAGSDTHATGSASINDIVTLSSGSSITYTVTGTLAPTASGAVVDTATITAPNTVFDGNAANNSASSTINVQGVPVTAVITANDITTAGGTSETITVVYSNPNFNIDQTTINASNLTVFTGEMPLTVTLTNISGSGKTVTATYSAAAPNGTWSVADDGAYTVEVNLQAVYDTSGDYNQATFQNFNVNIPDTTPPTAVITAPAVTTVGQATETVSVTYTDDVAVKYSTIADSNISVLSPSSQLLAITGFSALPTNDSNSITVMYTVAAPNGGFEAVDNGTYTVSVVANQVTDTSSNPVAVTSTTFMVNVHGVSPTAMITAPNVTAAGGSSETVTVVYSDPNSPINTSTIVASNLTVTTPGNTQLNVTLSNISGSGNTVTATYSVAAPGGAWAISDNGTYSIAIAAGAVSDNFGDSNIATSTTFAVAIADTTAPTAVISAPNVTIAGATTETVTVVYTDNVAVNVATIGTGNISVIGPASQSLTVTGFTAMPNMSAQTITATYTVAAPGGGFEAINNGTYTVSLLSNQVKDTAGNAATAMPITFTANVSGVPPTAVITAPNVTTGGGASETVTVVYNNPNSAINVATIASSNLTVTTPSNTQLTVTLKNISGSGNTVAATYTVAAPGGAWAMSANGTYTIAIAAGAVKDNFGDGNSATSTTFTVTVPDTTPPSAVISAPNVTTNGAATETVTVTYTDNFAVKASTVNTGNIVVLDPSNQPLTVTSVIAIPNANAASITAIYTVSAPGGGFVKLDNGTYIVSLTTTAGKMVTDTSGNAAIGTPVTFTVNVSGISPTASITAPNVTTAGGATETITVVYSDPSVAINTATIAASNLTVKTPSNTLLPVTLKNITASGNSVTATYTVPAPGGAWAIADNGTYSIAIAANVVQSVDGDGNTAASATFMVTVPDTTPPTAVITAPNVTTVGTATEKVTVFYTDNVAVLASSIGIGDISVVDPLGATLTVLSATAMPNANAATITATYVVQAPGGAFEATSNGTYTVSLLAGQVTDTSGNAATATPVTFTVNVHGAAPSALITAPDVTTAGGTTELITVLYSNPNAAIDTTTFAASNLTVTGPGGVPLVVTFTGFTGSGKSVTANYSAAAPGGSWQLSSNGSYTLAVNGGAVLDVDGDGNTAASTTFSVAIPTPDTTPPTASISAPNVTVAGDATEIVTVVYNDNVAVEASTINFGNIEITAPDGDPLTVTAVGLTPNANAATITAAYTVAAPGGAFEALDNGNYSISLLANQVSDTSGNFVAAASAMFAVNVQGTPPTVAITAPAIATTGVASETVTVVYTDSASPVNTATLAASNLTVTGPGSTLLNVTFTNVTGSGDSVTATYAVAAPSGTWQVADNGTYTITVNAGAVQNDDGDSNAIASGTFAVAILSAAPTASTTTLTTSDTTVDAGTTIKFRATVASASSGTASPAEITPLASSEPMPTGTVTFTINGGNPTTVPVQSDGTASFAISFQVLGTDSIVATYSGDSNYTASTSATLVLTVAPLGSSDGILMVGGLDPSFGNAGLASHNLGITAPSDLLVQNNFKSIVIGTNDSGSTDQFGVARYNPDGTLDTTFGQGAAEVETDFSGTAQAAAGGLLPNGNILVAGTVSTTVNGQTTGSQFALVEYNTDGSLDTGFGNNGIVLTSFSPTSTLSNDTVRAMAIRSNGEIFVAGQSDAGGHGLDFAVAAYNANGSPDTGFGTNGKVLIDFQNGDDSIASIALQRNGNVVAVGTTVNPSTGVTSVALAELLPNGSLDNAFGIKGKTITNVRGSIDGASSVAIGTGGKIVVAGFSATGSAAAGTLSSDFLLLRYNPGGKLDHSFGVGGVVITSFNQPSAASHVLLQSNGTILVSGKTTASLIGLVPSELDLAVARYTSNGLLDPTFAGTGEAIYSLSGTPVVESVTSPGAQQEHPALLAGLGIMPFDETSQLMMAFNELTQSVQGVVVTADGGDLFDVGQSDTDTVEAAIIGSGANLSAGLVANFTNTIVAGAKGMVTVHVGNAGAQNTSTGVSIELFASPDSQIDSGEVPFKIIPEKIKLKNGKAKTYRLRFQYPLSIPDGNYYLLTSISSSAVKILDPAGSTSSSAMTFHLAPPFVSFTGSGLSTPVFTGSKPATVTFQAVNTGDITASHLSAVEFLASPDGTLANATSLVTVPLKFNLKPGAAKLYREKVSLPASLPAGTYTLLALLDPANVFDQTNTAANLITGMQTFVVG